MEEDNDPYAKYKKPSAAPDDDPYAQYKKPKPAAAPKPVAKKPAAAPKPAKRDYTWSEALAAAPGSARQGIADALEGAGNLTYDMITAPGQTSRRVGNAALDVAGAVGNLGAGTYTNMLSPATKAQLAAADPRFAKASATADAVGDYYAGYTDPAEVRRRIAEKPISTIADVASVATLPMGVGGVARAAATAPRGARVAAALNAADEAPTVAGMARSFPRYAAVPTHLVNDATAYVAGRAIPTAARKLETVTHPTNAMMMRGAEGRGPQYVQSIRNAGDIVPGSTPTTRQAAAAAGTPGLQAIARAAEKARPAQAEARKAAQHSARLNQLDNTIGAPVGMPTADHIANLETTREVNRARGYGAAYPQVAPIAATGDPVMDILGRPLNSDVLGRAEQIAASDATGASQFTRPQPQQVIPDPFGQNLPPTVIPAQQGSMNGAFIDDVKKAFDDIAYKGKTNLTGGGLSPREVSVLRDNREDFLRWVDQHIPEYTAARRQYQGDSHDIDRAMMIKYLKEKLNNSTLGDETVASRADNYSNAMREAPGVSSTVRASTGDSRFRNLEDRFNPQQMGQLNSIQDDLARAKMADEQVLAGAPEFGTAIQSPVSDAIGIDVNGPYGWMARPLFKGLNTHVANRNIDMFQTPDGAATLMENALARERNIGRLNAGYGLARNTATYINPVRWANRYPALYNVMGIQQQQKQP